MPQVRVGMEVVLVAPSLPLMRQVPVGFEIPNNPLSSSLRDSNASSDIAEPDVWGFGNQDQHPGVIGEERPGASLFGGQWSTPVL